MRTRPPASPDCDTALRSGGCRDGNGHHPVTTTHTIHKRAHTEGWEVACEVSSFWPTLRMGHGNGHGHALQVTTDRVVVVRPFVLNGMCSIPYQAVNENHNRCVFGLVKLGFARTLAMLLMMLALFLSVFWTPCVKQRKQSHTRKQHKRHP